MLALNYGLMIEMMKQKGKSNAEIIQLVKNGKSEELQSFGEGIPHWQFLIDYYQANPTKLENAINSGYQMTFLTKGALKGLLEIKFGLKENSDFSDKGYYLDGLELREVTLVELQSILASNWKIVIEKEHKDRIDFRIELTYPPATE
jgi:hypothetical protein